MITNFSKIVNESLGSSLSLTAHGRVGTRATSTMAAHFALQNTHSKSAEKRAVRSEGEAEGGCGGNSASPERLSPAAPPENLQGGTEQKNFLFLLKEKNGRAQNQKMRRKFFCEVVARASAEASGGASSLVGVLVKKSSDFVQKVPPFYEFFIFGRDCLAASPLGRRAKRARARFCEDLPRSAWPKGNGLISDLEVRLGKVQSKTKFCNQSFFVSPLAKLVSDNFNILTA